MGGRCGKCGEDGVGARWGGRGLEGRLRNRKSASDAWWERRMKWGWWWVLERERSLGEEQRHHIRIVIRSVGRFLK